MRAALQDRYGSPDALRVGEAPDPVVNEGDVLVRVRAASVNAGDWRRVRADPWILRIDEGIRRPKSPLFGVDAAGIVEAVGGDVTHVQPGDEVYGMRMGAFSELVSGRDFVLKPTNLTFEEAAAVPAAGCTALQAVRDHGQVEPGQRVLVNGAGGGVGTFAVQLAKAFGAAVTAVTSSGAIEMVRSLGADRVIEHRSREAPGGKERYDVIVELGGRGSIRTWRGALVPTGRLVLVGAGTGLAGPVRRIAGGAIRAKLGQPVVAFIAGGPFRENLETLAGMIEAGTVRPVIHRTYPLDEIAAAIRHVEEGRARGKVVVTVP